jgi:DNA modification methylase
MRGRMKDVLEGRAQYALGMGKAEDLLPRFPDGCLDSIVTDPPAGIAFMGEDWDEDKGGAEEWIDWLAGVMKEGLRALKPGGYALVWAIPRTSFWTGMALYRAGFEVRDVVTHIFGSGFPKSMNIGKAIDKKQGAEREVIGYARPRGSLQGTFAHKNGTHEQERPNTNPVTAPSSPEAQQWEGWGTALKPATEHWILARKPFNGSCVNNVLTHGTGALNIDGCRVTIAPGDRCEGGAMSANRQSPQVTDFHLGGCDGRQKQNTEGRWPANLVLSHSPDCGEEGACVPGCPVAMLDKQSGERPGARSNSRGHTGLFDFGTHDLKEGYNDNGGASRFFTVLEGPDLSEPFLYCAKPSKREKDAGLEHLPVSQTKGGGGTYNEEAGGKYGSIKAPGHNAHPTVKSIALMRWLCRLVTPPGGIVADFFMGSGTTGAGAVLEGFRFIGTEMEEDSFQTAEGRIAHWEAKEGGQANGKVPEETAPSDSPAA